MMSLRLRVSHWATTLNLAGPKIFRFRVLFRFRFRVFAYGYLEKYWQRGNFIGSLHKTSFLKPIGIGVKSECGVTQKVNQAL